MDESISNNVPVQKLPDDSKSLDSPERTVTSKSISKHSLDVKTVDWETLLEEQLDELSDEGDSDIDRDVDEEVSEYVKFLDSWNMKKITTSHVTPLLTPLCRENKKLRRCYAGVYFSNRSNESILKDSEENLRMKSLECDNLYQKYFLLEEKLAESEARFNSQQISFDDRESACLAREKRLEADLAAALDKIKMLEDDLKKFNTSSSKLTTMLGASKNHRDTRGLGYKGIDAPSISKEVKFVKASDSSQQKVSTDGKSEIPSPAVKVQKSKVYQPPKLAHTDRGKNIPYVCHYCGNKGHLERRCRFRIRNEKLHDVLVWASQEVVKPRSYVKTNPLNVTGCNCPTFRQRNQCCDKPRFAYKRHTNPFHNRNGYQKDNFVKTKTRSDAPNWRKTNLQKNSQSNSLPRNLEESNGKKVPVVPKRTQKWIPKKVNDVLSVKRNDLPENSMTMEKAVSMMLELNKFFGKMELDVKGSKSDLFHDNPKVTCGEQDIVHLNTT